MVKLGRSPNLGERFPDDGGESKESWGQFSQAVCQIPPVHGAWSKVQCECPVGAFPQILAGDCGLGGLKMGVFLVVYVDDQMVGRLHLCAAFLCNLEG